MAASTETTTESLPCLAGGWMSDSEKKLATELLALDQSHLFSEWKTEGDEDKKHAFFEQVQAVESGYPGGIKAYVNNAKALLESSKAGANPFEGYKPEVPTGETLEVGSPQFSEFESKGLALMKDCAFCLVAGGLGERLGYGGIKVSLPVECTTKRKYLEVYCQHILALQAASNAAAGTDRVIPLAIMTSDDTHERTQKLIADNDSFGMAPGQIVLMKQEKVPALVDNAAHFTCADGDAYTLATKPHGHGDVHSLLHSTGLARKWADEGRKYLVFFQDTNALAFLVTTATVGVSATHSFEVNSVTVPRKAKDAMGAITRLVKEDGSAMTCNVEYNQLEPLLLASGFPEGDVNDASGFSPFPGNINQLVFSIPEYADVLAGKGGAVPEFVNPKYADSAKTKFKKPTRLECMMQDHPKMLGPDAKVGFTTFAEWAFVPVKNSVAEAASKAGTGVPMRCASEGELAYYGLGCRFLRAAGADVAPPADLEVTGFTLPNPPHVVFFPRFTTTWAGAVSKISGGQKVVIEEGSTLVVNGADVQLRSLKLQGSLVIEAVDGATVIVEDAVVQNAGHKLVATGDDAEEALAIRGFDIVNEGAAIVKATQPGTYTLAGAIASGETVLQKM